MRKWLWSGALTVALGGIGGFVYFQATPEELISLADLSGTAARSANVKDDGGAESSEAIEPIDVDRGGSGVPNATPGTDDGPMSRVVLEPGMKQPPRPDEEPGRTPRMPYADEEEILGVTRLPLQRILGERDRTPLNLFEELEKPDPAEEPEVLPPPMPVPVPDYHQQHCPYQHCPYPYR